MKRARADEGDGGGRDGGSGEGNGQRGLPPGWEVCMSEKYGREYWFHAETGQSRWTPPSPPPAEVSASAASAAAAAAPGAAGAESKEEKEGAEEDGRAHSRKVARRRTTSATTGHRVAIVVPFRNGDPTKVDRGAHLRRFVPHMVRMLDHLVETEQIGSFAILVIEQCEDNRKFNRGKLLNAGFDLAVTHPPPGQAPADVIIFHDVDLLPEEDIWTEYARIPEERAPLHIAGCWDRYSGNQDYFGGIVSFTAAQFVAVNGFPNNYWGWGGEDDELRQRLREVRPEPFQHVRPSRQGTIVDLEGLSLTAKLDVLRQVRDHKCNNKWELRSEHSKTWSTNGIKQIEGSYTVQRHVQLHPPTTDAGSASSSSSSSSSASAATATAASVSGSGDAEAATANGAAATGGSAAIFTVLLHPNGHWSDDASLTESRGVLAHR